MKLSQYLGFGSTDAANNLTFSTVSAFLLIYYTNVAGITAAAAGTLFLVVRMWCGFTDLFAGRRVDETQTRWGKFRPYVLFGPVSLLVLLVAVFSIPGGLSLGGKLAWAYVSYALF
jgi:glucuronide carrier protein